MNPLTTNEIATLLLMPQILTQDEYSKLMTAWRTIAHLQTVITERGCAQNGAAMKLLEQTKKNLITLLYDRQFNEYIQKEGVL